MSRVLLDHSLPDSLRQGLSFEPRAHCLNYSGWPAFPVSVSYVLESWASHHDYLAFLCELEIWTQFSCLQANVSPMSHIFSSPKCVFLNSLQSFSKRRINNLGTVCIAFCYCGQEATSWGEILFGLQSKSTLHHGRQGMVPDCVAASSVLSRPWNSERLIFPTCFHVYSVQNPSPGSGPSTFVLCLFSLEIPSQTHWSLI